MENQSPTLKRGALGGSWGSEPMVLVFGGFYLFGFLWFVWVVGSLFYGYFKVLFGGFLSGGVVVL